MIPIENTLLYVEPIYLQAEAAAYPELRLVAVMHNDKLSYAETFEKALRGLYGEKAPLEKALALGHKQKQHISTEEQIERLKKAFDKYLEAMSKKRFKDASEALETMDRTLQRNDTKMRDRKKTETREQLPQALRTTHQTP